MGNNQQSTASADFQPLEFELVDIADARAKMEELPDGIGYLQRLAIDWAAQRRKPVVTDRALTSAALVWLAALPPLFRPHQTSQLYPRVINELVARWESRQEAFGSYLDELLQDRRGGRKGFPADVRSELELLRQHQAALAKLVDH
jgi:hypothetical protein